MRLFDDVPWERYGLVVELARTFGRRSPQFGKTALQKLVYILEACYSVRLGYEFSLYTYGPYSHELASDLEVVASMGLVELTPRPNGYLIQEGRSSKLAESKSERFLQSNQTTLKKLIKDFEGFSAKDLELRATLIFLAKNDRDQTDLITSLINLKPYFVRSDVQKAIDELKTLGYV